MLEAVVVAVADKGYAATTVADVIALAGVSRRTFYEQFPDIRACFLDAYDAGRERLTQRIRDAVARLPQADWPMRARASLKAYLEGMAGEPAAARVYSIEVLGAGPEALEKRAATFERWVGQWQALVRLARRQGAAVRPPSDAELLALVGGIEELVRDCLRRRGAENLPQLLDSATALAMRTIEV